MSTLKLEKSIVSALLTTVLLLTLAAPQTKGVLTKVLLANGQGEFQQNPNTPLNDMYPCGRDSPNRPDFYKDTWSSNNVRDCLYGDDGVLPNVPASIDIIYPFFLDQLGFLYGVRAKMTITGEATLSSLSDLSNDKLRFYIFNFGSASWVELGNGISQHPHLPNPSDDCENTAFGAFSDSTISVTLTRNLQNYADANGNMKLRWFVADTTNIENGCLFARIDFMQIVLQADSIPTSP